MTVSKKPLQKVNCPLCNCNRQQLLLTTRDRLDPDSGEVFQITVCAGCGFAFLNPRPAPEQISRYYASEDYDPFLSSTAATDLWGRMYKLARDFMLGSKRRKITKYVQTGRLLDVGCGTGEFLSEMRAHGWEVAGLETDGKAADFARRKYHLQIHRMPLTGCQFPGGQFDVITLWHVLEHVFNPLETLKKISEIMVPGGMLFIAAPNIDSLDAGFYKNDWVALDAPRHLLHLTPASIRKMLQTAAMGVVRQQQMPLDAVYNCLMSERLIWSKNTKSVILLPFYLLRGLVIAVLAIVKAFIDNGGSSVLYFAQKVGQNHDI